MGLTPHNSANKGDIASSVLMCGDPMRVKHIAETYLEDIVKYNSVRSMYGYTGYWHGKRVSVQGHGIGSPSIGIYSYELFKFYGVENIIRLGTCGACKADIPLGSLVIAAEACTDSRFGYQYGQEYAGTLQAADEDLLRGAVEMAGQRNIQFCCGKVFSSDVFYAPEGSQDLWMDENVLAVEMEVHALYTNAKVLGGKALGLLMVSDNLASGTDITAEAREKGYDGIIRLALDLL